MAVAGVGFFIRYFCGSMICSDHSTKLTTSIPLLDTSPPRSTPTPTGTNETTSSGPSVALIAGVSVGVTAIVVAAIVLGGVCLWRKKKKQNERMAAAGWGQTGGAPAEVPAGGWGHPAGGAAQVPAPGWGHPGVVAAEIPEYRVGR